MSTSIRIESLKKKCRDFLAGHMTGNQLVREVDDMIHDDSFADANSIESSLIDDLHLGLSLYVSDEMTRREAPESYIGDDELKMKVESFLAALK